MFLVISPGRSGSSYVAGKLIKGGIWGGRMRGGNQWNPGGYFENIELHRLVRQWYGTEWASGEFPREQIGWHDKVKRVIESQGYTDGPWLFKVGAFYWKTFESFEPTIIKVWRDPDLIYQSYMNCGFLSDKFSEDEIKHIIERQHKEMETIQGLDVKI